MDHPNNSGSNKVPSSSTRQPIGPTAGFSSTSAPTNSGFGVPRPPPSGPTPGNNQKIFKLQDLLQQRINLEKQYNEQVEEHETLTALLVEGQQYDKDARSEERRVGKEC